MDKRIMSVRLLYLLLLSASIAWAERPLELDFNLDSKVSDNAIKHKNQVYSERQDTATLSILADHENAWSKIEADYRNSWYWYAKDSQQQQRRLMGRGRLLLGSDNSRVGLRLSHSIEETLDKANKTDLLKNKNQRQISRAAPYIKLRLSKVDNFTLSADIADIKYPDDSDRNSQREGGSLQWQHRLSHTDGFNIDAALSDISFDQFTGAGYRYESANFSYFSQLRQFSYQLLAGVNRYQTDGQESNSQPLYELTLGYRAARNIFNLRLGQRYSDSSQGNNNDVGFDSGSVGSSSRDLDIYERNFGRLTWTFLPVLERLETTFFAEYERESYENLSDNNSREKGYGLVFRYKLDRSNSLSLRFDSRSNMFEREEKDFVIQRASVRYVHPLASGINLNAYWNYEQRNNSDIYTEQQLGVRASYRY